MGSAPATTKQQGSQLSRKSAISVFLLDHSERGNYITVAVGFSTKYDVLGRYLGGRTVHFVRT